MQKKFIIAIIIWGICFSANACQKKNEPRFSSGLASNTEKKPNVTSSEGMDFTASMKIGWNLGNSLDAHFDLSPDEYVWGNPWITQELMNAVASYGFGAVRIPVTWGEMIGDAPDYTLDEWWLDRVAEVVGYVESAGMKAIINIHHDGADSHYWLSVKHSDLSGVSKDAIDAKFGAVWTQIAERFKHSGKFLLFEAFNELHDGTWGDGTINQRMRINELNQIFVDTIRAVGGENTDRYLVIPGWVTRASITVASLILPEDTTPNRLIVTFHYYDPYDFAGAAKQTVWGNRALPGNWANETHAENTFNSVKKKFADNGIPVIIGEYGAVNQYDEAGKAYRKYYMEYITKLAHDCGFVPFYWDNGGNGEGSEKFGLIDRRKPHGLMHDAKPILDAMMKAVNEDYLLSDIVAP
jgi:endoglucanase